MIESEAKTKWCPFARIAHVNAPTGGNRHYSGVGAEGALDKNLCRCIASDCMAWRETDKEYLPCSPDDTGADHIAYPAGYCGLAGKP